MSGQKLDRPSSLTAFNSPTIKIAISELIDHRSIRFRSKWWIYLFLTTSQIGFLRNRLQYDFQVKLKARTVKSYLFHLLVPMVNIFLISHIKSLRWRTFSWSPSFHLQFPIHLIQLHIEPTFYLGVIKSYFRSTCLFSRYSFFKF